MPSTTPSNPSRRPQRGGRIAAVVAATLAGLLGLAFVTAGGALLWANGKKDDQGYLTTGQHRFSARSHAIASDDLDVDLGGAGAVLDRDRYGAVRLQATPREGKPVFLGIARTDDVARYLRGSSHATVTDVATSPFHATYRSQGGDRRPAAPGAQRFWAASAHGAGTQTVRWDVRDGSWSVVVMNADGSAGVDAGVSAGADLPFLSAAGWSSIGGGVLFLVVAGALAYAGLRPPRPRSGALAPAASPAVGV